MPPGGKLGGKGRNLAKPFDYLDDIEINGVAMKTGAFLALSFLGFFWLFSGVASSEDLSPRAEKGIPVLAYHRFGPVACDGMTVTTPVFESHLKYLQENGYRVVSLREMVDRHLYTDLPPDARLVALTADDAHLSVYTSALPLIQKYRVPVTLFIYPSAVSNASYAMTWGQLRALKATGLFDFQSHTYWHPNFKRERKRLPAAEFKKLVDMQLRKSREKLEKELKVKVDLLAWPFGIYDPWLMDRATAAGYRAAFTIERFAVSREDPPMALPRYLMVDADRGERFQKIVNGYAITRKKGNGNGKKG
jgi:peptidoglycan/xylan/chitin deacetylase (PgdA/CDA1 family)